MSDPEDEDPIAATSEMPGAEPPEDEPLPTDPTNWSSDITDSIQIQLVFKGPSKVAPNFVFPRNEGDGRSCHHQYFKKTLVSGEKMPRSWLVYSEKNNSLFCFCCKLFSIRHINLTSSGLTDWKHASSLLTSHDNSPEHHNSIKAWEELVVRIKKGETIDKQEMALLQAEKIREWC
ncbi:zinc finger MYM-type protein 5-like [Polypterus senegalus]|uniref:zinc finger MYM-type protein 5-like n=1 Tax=Polypterus senegalus TaxID=55291 RepID=UPI00196578AF|nr:zinc finger MYM-type protein 5-like [Polypterus senegalus]